MESNDVRRVCVRGIIYKDGKLFCQELKDKSGQGRGFWCTPGGGLNYTESLVAGLKRELLEETGVEATVGKLLFVQQYDGEVNSKYREREALEFFFHITNPEDFEHIDEQASHFDTEISRYGFVNPKTANILPAFLKTIDIADYIENDRPIYIYSAFQA